MTDYAAPALTEAVVLADGYSVPALTVPVVLGVQDVTGTLIVDLPAVPVLPLDFIATDATQKGTLNAVLTLPNVPLTFAAALHNLNDGALSAALPQAAPALTAAAQLSHGRLGAIAATVPTVAVPLSFAAAGLTLEDTEQPGYSVPALTEPVVLAGDYAAPDLSLAVVLCQAPPSAADFLLAELPPPALPLTFAAAAERVHAPALAVELPAPSLPLNFSAAELPARSADSVFAKLPLQRPDTPSFAADGTSLHVPALAADLPTPTLPLLFRAFESMRDLAFAVDLPPPPLALTMVADAEVVITAQVDIDLPLPALSFGVEMNGYQIIDLPDADGPALTQQQQPALLTATPLAGAQQAMQPTRAAIAALMNAADPIIIGTRATDTSTLPAHATFDTDHQHGLPVQTGTRQGWVETIRTRRSQTQPHKHGIPIRNGSRAAWADTAKTRTTRQLTAQTAWPVDNCLPVFEQTAWRTQSRLDSRWTHADWPLPGRWWPFYEPPLLTGFIMSCGGDYVPRLLHCPVVLDWYRREQPPCPELPDGGTIIIPVLQVYTVINSFELKRASDNTVIETRDFSASIDVDSWTWSFNATVPADALTLLTPTAIDSPRELIATINGQPLRLIAERLSRSRRFGEAWLTVSGRGRAAWLADPYVAPETRSNNQSRTAQQLLNDALTINGVPIGWAVDWNLTDWTVPAGAWNHTGTYIEAAKRIAEAGGGYVQAHDTDPTLIIQPYYPAAPWAWSSQTPDIALPEDVCTVEGIEWQDKARYNAVYVVGGTNSGRQDRIKITGSAADRMAQTVVDELATDVQMTRQRGIRVLGDTGRQAWIDLELPVLPETGLIHPGQFVDYTENGVTRRGLTRALRINHQFPRLRQTITLETHESV